jgi:hypothetical protein
MGPLYKVNVTIRIEKQRSTSFGEIVQDLRTAGLTDVATHQRLLVVNGSVANDRIDDLRNIDGVASVREDATYKPQD